MSELTLTAGAARVDITPPVGFRMQGAMRRIEPSEGIESHLLATALVLADEKTKVVIFDCDLIGFDLPLAEKIRKAVGEHVGTPASHVLVGCTHTHNGPCTARGVLGGVHDVGGKPEERAALDAYIENLVGQLAGVAHLAESRRQPARVGGGRGEAPVAINREEVNEDGRILVGRNPKGTTDHSVDVLRVDGLDGKPIAVVVSYAAHPVVMGYHTYLLSPDYPGVTRRIVEQVTGATCLFLTGAAGNQAALSFLQSDWGEQERMGGLIGGAAVQAFFDIETRPHKVIREFDVSLSNIALYHKEFRDGPTHQIFGVASRQVRVPLQPLPSSKQAEANLSEANTRLEKLKEENAPTTKTYPALLVKRWAEGVVEKVKAGVTQETLSFVIVGVRLDDCVLVAMPGEPFVEIGLGVKKRSKAKHTMFAGYCNGVLAYWPTTETVAKGGMAVEASVKTYNISAPPVSEAVDTIVSGFDRLLDELGL
jgi:Neutral/alkaline non-lysosomal ceramidase, N-terminal